MIVYAVCDVSSSPDHPLGEFVDVFVRRGDAEHFVRDVRRDESTLALSLRIEPVQLEAGGRN